MCHLVAEGATAPVTLAVVAVSSGRCLHSFFSFYEPRTYSEYPSVHFFVTGKDSFQE